MSSTLLTAPAAEPITLADAKAYLRVATDVDDDIIGGLIGAARSHVEAQSRRALITQTWRLVRDAWPPDGRLKVVPVPLRTVAAARVYEADGSTLAIDTQAFVADKAAAPAILSFMPWTLPAPGQPAAGIEIDVEVGYGASGAAVPEPLRLAIRILVAHWYENRGLIALGHEVAVLPETAAALIAPYRVLSL
jgi:uncharacterized phiE125 gp8 family phage protein